LVLVEAWCWSVLNAVEPPFPGNTGEFVVTSVLELDSRAGDQVLDRGRHEYLACAGVC
jgi:hypothetical protein